MAGLSIAALGTLMAGAAAAQKPELTPPGPLLYVALVFKFIAFDVNY